MLSAAIAMIVSYVADCLRLYVRYLSRKNEEAGLQTAASARAIVMRQSRVCNVEQWIHVLQKLSLGLSDQQLVCGHSSFQSGLAIN